MGCKCLTAAGTSVRCYDQHIAARQYEYLGQCRPQWSRLRLEVHHSAVKVWLSADQEDVYWQAEWAYLVGMLAVEHVAVLVGKALQEQRLQKMQPAAKTSNFQR